VNNDPVNFVDRTGLGDCGFLICDSITVNGSTNDDPNTVPGVVSSIGTGTGLDHDQVEEDSNGGAGQGGGSDPLEIMRLLIANAIAARSHFLSLMAAFFKARMTCLSAFEKLELKHNISIYDTIERALFLKVSDLPEMILNNTLGTLGLVSSSDENATTLLKDFFATNAAGTLFDSRGQSFVFLSDFMYDKAKQPAGLGALAADELFHLMFQKDHSYIAKSLGLTKENLTDGEATKLIDDWLRDGCPSKE
jgi:hypothetical protein